MPRGQGKATKDVPEAFVSRAEAAKLVGLTRDALRKMDGVRLSPITIGGAVYYHRFEIHALVMSRDGEAAREAFELFVQGRGRAVQIHCISLPRERTPACLTWVMDAADTRINDAARPLAEAAQPVPSLHHVIAPAHRSSRHSEIEGAQSPDIGHLRRNEPSRRAVSACNSDHLIEGGQGGQRIEDGQALAIFDLPRRSRVRHVPTLDHGGRDAAS